MLVLSAFLVWRRFAGAPRVVLREEDFARILGAALVLIAVGTATYTFGGPGASSTDSTSPSQR